MIVPQIAGHWSLKGQSTCRHLRNEESQKWDSIAWLKIVLVFKNAEISIPINSFEKHWKLFETSEHVLKLIHWCTILSFQIDRLLSDLGGILALYIGFSALTLLEFWELSVDFLVLGLIKIISPANCKSKPIRRNSKAKIEPFVTKESSGESAETGRNDTESSQAFTYPCQMQNLTYWCHGTWGYFAKWTVEAQERLCVNTNRPGILIDVQCY